MSKNDEPQDTAREISPVKWLEDPELEDNLYDFRPIDRPYVEELEPIEDPKGSSAAEPADSSESKTPLESQSSEKQENPVPVEKDSTPPKASGTGKQTSSAPKTTATGPSKQPA